ncbi:MAG: NAD(P)-dependent methylenetetrahydromethanopterin dehydrogenase, partial [Planctomycetota bacterium]
MSKPKILIQLDSDPHASVFDAVVAVDAGVDHLLQYHQVTLETVRDLVHGAMFTRGPDDLRSTAIFIGGAQVSQGEALLKKVKSCFFGPMRVSVMLDANGANTTAAAAVLAAAKHLNLGQIRATVLAGTGPVGQRAARLLAQAGAEVRVASR